MIVTSRSSRWSLGSALLSQKQQPASPLLLNLGRLVIRNLLPSRSFRQAIQSMYTAGDERKVTGPYLPTLTYVKDARTFDRQHRR